MNYLLYISLALVAYTTGSRAQIVSPERAFAVNNGTVTLSCPAESTSWLRSIDNELVPVTAGSGVVLRGAELIIEGFHAHTHAGSYYCIATDNNVTMVSCPAEIVHSRIQASPFPVNPVNTVVNVNATTVMSCTPPFSEPAPTIHWRRDGMDVDMSDPRLTTLATGNLYITNTQLNDTGDYQCIAHNQITGATRRSTIGTLTVSTDLLTPAGPNVTITPDNLIKSPGGSAIVECVASGHPPPEILWEKLHSQLFPPTASVLPSGTLLIDPVTSGEGGLYRCIARNSEGEAYSDVRLEVRGPPDFTEEPPAMVAMGDVSALSWTVQDDGPVKALLFHNGLVLESMTSDNGLSLTHTLDSSSGGVYQCVVQGLYGCSRSSVIVTAPQGTTQTPATTTTSTPTIIPETTPTIATASATDFTASTPDDTGATTSPLPDTTQSVTDGVTTTNIPREMLVVYPESVELNGPIEIVCVATLTAVVPGVVWYGPSGNVLPSDDVVADLNEMNATLVVDSPGRYTCEAMWGVRVLVASVNVTPAPLGVLVSDSVTARVGEPVELLCGGEGSGASVEWSRASGSLREGGVVISVGQVTSKYRIAAVSITDEGDYVCTVTSPYFEQPLHATIRVTVLGLPIGPPLNVTVVVSPSGGLLLSWEPSQTELKLLGYKINYGSAEYPPAMVARTSTGADKRTFSVRSDVFFEYGYEVAVVLWAYSLQEEGAGLRVTVSPTGLVLPPETTTAPPTIGPPVLLTNVTLPDGGLLLSWEPPQTESTLLGYKINYGNKQHPPTMVARASIGIDKNYFLLRPDVFFKYGDEVAVVLWAYSLQEEGAGLRVTVSIVPSEIEIVKTCSFSSNILTYTLDSDPIRNLEYTCTDAEIVQHLDHSEEANGTVHFDNLLPSCTYYFRVSYEDGGAATCEYTTPFDQVDISADVHRHSNGSVSLRWILPVALRNQPQLSIDIDWGTGWVGVVSGEHLPVALESHNHNQKEDTIQLRFTLRGWSAVAIVVIPATPTTTVDPSVTSDPTVTSSLKSTELALLYGVIFGGLLVLCAVVLVVILSLKYIQSTRRENDKVSDDKEKEREYFRRMTLERVSINSVKRSAQSLASSTTTETDI